jgi:L-alanine-DL-glutamate epimerase-like enolase superfamily enzyme
MPRIVSLETLRPAFQPNVVLLRLTDDEGRVGLGETFFAASACEAYLHDDVAPVLLGLADPSPEQAAATLTPYVGYQGGGVETRCRGAVDIALWDLSGRRMGRRVVDLLGGPARDRIRIYNTCAGSGYVGTSSRQESANWGIGRRSPYEDLEAFLNRPAELARELQAEGIPGMKVWPFDPGAEKTGGADVPNEDLARGVSVVAAIREAAPAMDLMVELHGLWSLGAAETICRAVAPFEPFWVEDPIRPDAVDDLARLKDAVGVRIATGETVAGRRGFLPLLQRGVVGVVTADVQWTGGLSEALAISELADSFGVKVAPHDCTGPVTFAACVHLVLSRPNGLVQETVRAFLRTWYGELVEGLPRVEGGHVSLSAEPGLGLRVAPGLESRADVRRRQTRL